MPEHITDSMATVAPDDITTDGIAAIDAALAKLGVQVHAIITATSIRIVFTRHG